MILYCSIALQALREVYEAGSLKGNFHVLILGYRSHAPVGIWIGPDDRLQLLGKRLDFSATPLRTFFRDKEGSNCISNENSLTGLFQDEDRGITLLSSDQIL